MMHVGGIPATQVTCAQNMKVVTDHLSLLHRHGDQISEYDRHGGEGHPEIYYSVNSKPLILRLKEELQIL